MSSIESVYIEGFWGNHSVSLNFNPEVNFLVGVNGSGKTTAIDILASALQVDEDALERLPFKKIEIVLFDKITRRKPSITVVRKWNEEAQFASIDYKIKPSATATFDETKDYSQLAYYLQFNQKMHRPRVRNFNPPRGGVEFRYREIRAELAKLIKMNWLSINRASSFRSGADRNLNETHVDRKLREISDRLERYFSSLSSEASQQTRDFQRKLFRSLISINSDLSLINILSDIDFETEKKSLNDIFDRFSIPSEEYVSDTNRFFEVLDNIKNKDKNSTYKISELASIINAHKIHYLVGEWNEAVEEEKKILQPRDAFVKILDDMFNRKSADVLPSGEIIFISKSGKQLQVFDLSSGEKQLFIILAEALLQKDAEWTYIADEPELSLHVDWQEVLVDNLRTLNPNSQVIFATHSPDIISHFSDYVIDMEEAIE